ncbi:restriction endonuclease subunit S [Corynebacterium phoceense]|uniref:restriction endonuclease subunit S n=1 Tax=Corynebacterium phoceense TaxID=1686286 RepID=UPI00211C411F|nr:restriction endonuclease subunit S [Corynebacterium phoceense]MCQ9334886.1 restriction endonuclease subunit S [Corynebacterium phoceense]
MKFTRTPLWSIATVNDEVLSDDTDADFEFTYVDIASISDNRISDSTYQVSFREAPSRARRVVQLGDIALSTVRTYLRAIAPVTEDYVNAVFSTGFAIIRPDQTICNPSFLRYALLSNEFIDEVVSHSNGVSYPSITAGKVMRICIDFPILEAQRRIADYLDRETAEIDAAVADLDKYMELLEKRGKVLIEKTVNGGTNSFSPLWSKIRVQNGFAFDSEKFSPTKELPVAKIGNVLPGDFSEFIDASELPSESFLIKDGDLVVGMSGDFNRTIWNKGKAALNQRVCILKPIADDDIRYINYAIGSGLKKIHSTKFSTTLKNLSTEEILAIRVPHRTVTEQKEIATYLDKETAEINDLVVESTRLRDLLLKRRSVLITEVVTGRKQV